MKNKPGKFFNLLPKTQKVYSNPLTLLHALFAVICILYPVLIPFAAFDEKIYTWPAHLIIAFVFIYIISSLSMIWSSFQWWSGYKKLLSLSLSENGPIARIAFSYFLNTLSKFLGVAIGISGTVTLLSCSLIFSDFEFYEILEGFGLDFFTSEMLHKQGLIAIKIAIKIGIKMQGLLMFPILIYMVMFILKLLSELFYSQKFLTFKHN
jgi:hypothetical protein